MGLVRWGEVAQMKADEQERPTKAQNHTQFPRSAIDRGLPSASDTCEKTEVARLQLKMLAKIYTYDLYVFKNRKR